MAVILSKPDDAIDDMENGRVISEEELWTEIGAERSGKQSENCAGWFLYYKAFMVKKGKYTKLT